MGRDGVIATFAGNGTFTSVPSPNTVAVRNGSVHFSGGNSRSVTMVDAASNLTRIAGDLHLRRRRRTGRQGPNSATGPWMAFDAAGNLFVADIANHAVRRIDVAGTITTVAEAELGSAGCRRLRPSGRLYIAEPGGNRFVRPENLGALTVVAGGRYAPREMAVRPRRQRCSGRSPGLRRSRRASRPRLQLRERLGPRAQVDTTGTITTVVGPGGPNPDEIELCRGGDMELDGAGRLLVADRGGVLRFDLAGGVTRVAGKAGGFGEPPLGDGGLAIDAYLACPGGGTSDGRGDIYLGDPERQRVRRIDPAGVLSTVADGGNSFPGDDGQAPPACIFVQGSETSSSTVSVTSTSAPPARWLANPARSAASNRLIWPHR